MQTGLEQAFHVDGFTTFDQEFWNRFVRELAARFRGLEDIKISWEEVSRQGIDVALERINNVITPAAEGIRRLTELGFLVAASETPATLTAGQVVTLEVVAGPARDLFTPSPFVLVGRSQSADDYAVARLRSYDNTSGALDLELVTVAGDAGPHADWTIGALAGSTIAQLMMLDEGRGLAATVVAAAARIADDLAASVVSADAARDHANEAKAYRDATIEAARPLTFAAIVAALGFTPGASNWLLKSANYAAKSGERIMADTSAAGFSLTLPEGGGTVEVQDAAGTWKAKPLTIVGPVRGATGDMICDQPGRLLFARAPDAAAWVVTKSDGVPA